MRTSIMLAALAGTFAAAPALAQLNVGLGGRVGVGADVGVDTGRTIGGVRDTLGRTVDAADRTVNGALGHSLAVATRADVRSGVVVRDRRGHRVGTIQSVSADGALVVQGNRVVRVPLSSLYRSSTGLVTGLSRAQLRADATAQAKARAESRR